MTGNYFLLARQAAEIGLLTQNYSFVSAFSQEKDKLVLCFEGDRDREVYIELSCSPRQPYILLRDQFHRARKNTLDFFKTIGGRTLVNIEIAKFERVIKFNFTGLALCFVIHGNLSNVLCCDERGGVECFKKLPEDEKFIDFIKNADYLQTENLCDEIQGALLPIEDEAELVALPALGRELRSELLHRRNLNGLALKLNLLAMINEILNERLNLVRLYNPSRLVIAPPGFNCAGEVLLESESVNRVLYSCIIEESKTSRAAALEGRINKFLVREIKFLSGKMEKMRAEAEHAERSEVYRQYADLILSNSSLAPKGSSSLQAPDFNEPERLIVVKLNPLLTPYENAQYYYSKARNAQKQKENIEKDLPTLKRKLEKYLGLKEQLDNVKSNEEIQNLADQLNLGGEKVEGRGNSEESKYRRFIIEEKYLILVGKDAHNNDQLTLKTAKPNDCWLHARGCSGSHVVIRNTGSDPIPKYVLQAAASLAAYYSKAKNSKMVPVAHTQKKYVIKRKGMDPGQVSLTRESVIMAKPEIPEICKLFNANDQD